MGRFASAVVYLSTNMVNDTSTTDIFMTVLTAKSDTTLTSTATVDNVQLEYDGRMIRCRDDMRSTNQQVGVLTVASRRPVLAFSKFCYQLLYMLHVFHHLPAT